MTAFIVQNMAPIMFGALVIFLLLGYPVAFALAANGLVFALLGIELGLFRPDFLQALPERVYGVMNNDTMLLKGSSRELQAAARECPEVGIWGLRIVSDCFPPYYGGTIQTRDWGRSGNYGRRLRSATRWGSRSCSSPSLPGQIERRNASARICTGWRSRILTATLTITRVTNTKPPRNCSTSTPSG